MKYILMSLLTMFAVYPQGATALPQSIAVSPPSGSGGSQLFTFAYSAGGMGVGALAVVNALINNYLDGRNACYLAYAPSTESSGILYLVDNSGNNTTSTAIPGSGTLSNSQCALSAAASTATFANGVLLLSVYITFSPTFQTNSIVYLASRNSTDQGTGWQPLGTWRTTNVSAQLPRVVSASPSAGRGLGETFTWNVEALGGWQSTAVINILINNGLNGVNACYLAFVPSSASSGILHLVTDQGDPSITTSSPLGSSGSLTNLQCSIDLINSSFYASGNQMTLSLDIAFPDTFSGNRINYSAVRTSGGGNSGWQAVGVWNVSGAMSLSDFRTCLDWYSSGSCVLAPNDSLDGAYEIAATIEVRRSNLVVSADWTGVRLKRASTFNGKLMAVQDQSNVTIQGFIFDGNRSAYVPDSFVDPDVEVGLCNQCRVNGNSFVQSPHIALSVDPRALRSNIAYNRFDTAYHFGIYSGTPPSQAACGGSPTDKCLYVYSNVFFDVGTNALFLTSHRANIGYNVFSGNHRECSYSAPGGQIDLDKEAYDIDVFWNTFSDGPICANNGFWADGIEIHGMNIRVTDNIIQRNAGSGIYMEEAQNVEVTSTDPSRVIVQNNRKGSGFPGCGAFPGIRIHSQSDRRATTGISISNTNIVHGHGWGIDITACGYSAGGNASNIAITGNCFAGNIQTAGTQGVNVQQVVSNLTISGNAVSGCGPAAP